MKKNSYFVIVKGCKYDICFFDDERSYLGQTNSGTKQILIYSQLSKQYLEKTIFHELLHAYFDECGLSLYSGDETLVTYLDSIYGELGQDLSSIIKMHSEYKKGG